MKTIKLLAVIISAIVFSNCSNKKPNNEASIGENLTETIKETPIENTLFNRLGGEEGISSIVDGIVEAHLLNPVVKHVFLPIAENPERLEALKKHSREFLSAGTGGGATYTGKDLPTAHMGLKTTEKEFLSAVDDILMVLDNHNIDEETKKDMLFILYSMKGAVIGK